MRTGLSALAWTAALLALAGGARGAEVAVEPAPEVGGAGGVWEELRCRRAGPVPMEDACWVAPPGGHFLAVDASTPPTVWRTEIDDDGTVTARVEVGLSARGHGGGTPCTPPTAAAPRAGGGAGAVQVHIFRVHDGDRPLVRWQRQTRRWAATATDMPPAAPPVPGASRLRDELLALGPDAGADRRRGLLWARGTRLRSPGGPYLPGRWTTPGWTTVEAGRTARIPAAGPGRLRVHVRPLDPGPRPGAVTPFDLQVAVPADRPPARLPSSARVRPGPPASAPTAIRVLDLELGSGRGTALATVTGSAAQLRTRLYRPRPVRLAAQEDTGLSPATGTDDPRTLAQHALGQGEYREAAFRVGRWLADDREDPDAWLAAARVQSRTGPIPGLLPDALAATERILRDRDAGGPVAAAATVREAARHAWLQSSAYSVRGVLLPAGGRPLVEQLAPSSPVLGLEGTEQRRAGVHHALPPGRQVMLEVPPDPGASGRWGIVRGLAINTSGRPAVVALGLDDGPPTRILVADPVVTFRLALPPGRHPVELTLPPDGDGTLSVGIDLPVEEGGDRWQLRQVAAVGEGEPAARFELPGVTRRDADPATRGAPTHLRIDAWWRGDGPLEIRVEAPDGERRVVLERTIEETAPHAGAGPDGPSPLVRGSAPLDLPVAAGWIRVGSARTAWARVALRQPATRSLAGDGTEESVPLVATEGDLAELSRRVLDAGDGGGEADARLRRAEWLLDAGLDGYARRDITAARSLPGASATTLGALDELDRAARAWTGPDHVAAHLPEDGAPLPLDLAACAGRGPAAWLDALEADDDASLLADGQLDELARRHPGWPAIQRELAHRALDRAREVPEAALQALLHGIAAREVVDDAPAARVVATATAATRPDPLLAADQSHDRVWLTSAAAPPDRLADPAGWARWTLLGAGLDRVDRVLATGTRWVVTPAAGAPDELTVTAFCEDLRDPGPGVTPECPLEIGGSRVELWTIPRGRVSTRTVRRAPGEPLTITLAGGGRARYAALALDGAGGGWQAPDRRASFHVARPRQPVRFTLSGPTRLSVEIAGRVAGADTPLPVATVMVDGEIRASLGGGPAVPGSHSDQGVAYGPVERVDLSVAGDGVHRIEVQGHGAPVAVRVTRRIAGDRILPELTAATGAVDDPAASAMAPPGGAGAVLPQPARGGTVEFRAALRDRWSVDFEPVDERDVFVELAATHRVRAGGDLWLRGGVLGRFRFTSTPSAGASLGIHQRIRPLGVRWSGQLTALVQDTAVGTRGALAGRARVDRPLRLGHSVVLVPHLGLRGTLQPADELDAVAGEADLEIASRYRQEHPFGLGAGAELLWRPWVEGELLLAGRIQSNADPATVDSAGGRIELRAYPRPVGVALRFDLDRRMADTHRPEAWWRSELSLEAWADLGPAPTWIRPELRLAYLFDPSRLEFTVGVAVLPGRRSLSHVAPPELLFEDVRGPAWIEGGWRR